MKKLLLVGAGGHGKVVADLAEHLAWDEIAFLDDKWTEGYGDMPWPVIGKVDQIEALKGTFEHALIAIGNNGIRLNYHRRLLGLGFEVPVLVHPSATVSPYAKIGAGTVVFANAAINVDVRIGEAAIVNTGATVDHDAVLGDAAHVAPGANIAGNVEIGERTWVGIGASVREGAKIGADVTIGAGAAVVNDIPAGTTALGVPARS